MEAGERAKIMYDFDPDEQFNFEVSDKILPDLPIREMHVIIYRDLHGYILDSFVWLEPTELIRIDEDALLAIRPAYGEC